MTHDTLVCPLHPDAQVRRYRTQGPNGPGVYPQCVEAGRPPHLVAWSDATAHMGEHDVRRERGAQEASRSAALSNAEQRVLLAAASGLTAPETARALGKSAETVKSQRRQAMLKLGARNISQAVSLAIAQGILESKPSLAETG